jgi:type IX secretion system substrate protein/PKD domain-containing protein/trypsin
MKKIISIVSFLFLFVAFLQAQISEGGIPFGFQNENLNKGIKSVQIHQPDFSNIDAADNDNHLKSVQIGLGIALEVDFKKEASITNIMGGRLYQLRIEAKGAKALSFAYDNFYLPEGLRFFIYSEDKQQVIGAFTHKNNRENGGFTTEAVKGEACILELFYPEGTNEDFVVQIEEVAYMFKSIDGTNGSDFCEVNVNCPEGDAWKSQRNGVAKIVLKSGAGSYLCSGSLVNNTALDNRPYFLTADHCGKEASLEDYSKWVFYFNYQSEGCPDPGTVPASNTISGAELISRAIVEESDGSDFKLLELMEVVPDSYGPYYNGWSRKNTAASSGVGIHHPQGDIKKISTFTSKLGSTPYASNNEDPNEKYWKVLWSETETNFGVTEGGSSGSPIFNQDGLIVGALTGGYASCTNTAGADYYGKFWYSWESNGATSDQQLQPWLDPDGLNYETLGGMGSESNVVIAQFQTDGDTIALGEAVNFTDMSIGGASSWDWYFEGGQPQISSEQNPQDIKYQNFGLFDVRLVVSNGINTDTLLRKNLITVKPLIGPIPCSGSLVVSLGDEIIDELGVNIYNLIGEKTLSNQYFNVQNSLTIDLSHFRSDLYFVEIVKEGYSSMHKVILAK